MEQTPQLYRSAAVDVERRPVAAASQPHSPQRSGRRAALRLLRSRLTQAGGFFLMVILLVEVFAGVGHWRESALAAPLGDAPPSLSNDPWLAEGSANEGNGRAQP